MVSNVFDILIIILFEQKQDFYFLYVMFGVSAFFRVSSFRLGAVGIVVCRWGAQR